VLIYLGLISTLPWGYVSDLYGRKIVLFLNAFGLSLKWTVMTLVGNLRTVPVEWMLVGPMLTLIGGGGSVLEATTDAAVADFVPNGWSRTNVFACKDSMSYLTTLLAPIIAAYTMPVNLWLPFWIGFTLLLLSMVTALIFLPNLPTTPISEVSNSSLEERSSLLEHSIASDNTRGISNKPSLHRAYSSTKDAISSLAGRKLFRLLIGITVLDSFAKSTSVLLVQYISKRYEWKLSDATYLLSFKAIVVIAWLMVIVPFLIWLARAKFHIPEKNINIYGSQINLLISIIGAVGIAASPRIYILMLCKFSRKCEIQLTHIQKLLRHTLLALLCQHF
jgi:MFS family permease